MNGSTQHPDRNRSVPDATVIPVLAYQDVRVATDWLCGVFGFRERLRIGEHRSQLIIGTGAIMVGEYVVETERPVQSDNLPDWSSHSVMVRIDDVQAHYEHARAAGAQILQPPFDRPYGERQYMVKDIGGHIWTFSETIADVHPNEWGDSSVKLLIP